MKTEKTLMVMLWIETAALLILTAGITLNDSTGNIPFELFGALLASMLTTFGLFEMRKLT